MVRYMTIYNVNKSYEDKIKNIFILGIEETVKYLDEKDLIEQRKEKVKKIREIAERRYTVIENRKDRKHYRKEIGEIRFGEKGQGMELNKFYEMID